MVLPVLAALGVSTDLLTLGAHYGLDIDFLFDDAFAVVSCSEYESGER